LFAMPNLTIKNLKISTGGKKILHGVSLVVKPGETHVLMGPNGSGKSTLAAAILRRPDLKIDSGSISFGGKSLRRLSTDRIAALGIRLAFQQPVAVPGVNLPALIFAATKKLPTKKLGAESLTGQINKAVKALKLAPEFLARSVNEGFSGGEKKKTEILQLALMPAKLVVLDEIDSGLDVDSLKLVAGQIRKWRRAGTSLLIITHYPRLLKYIPVDKVHIMKAGRVVTSGDKELAARVEKLGYADFNNVNK
jgi:Fe-S cluster assembly ATP-binding protein